MLCFEFVGNREGWDDVATGTPAGDENPNRLSLRSSCLIAER